MAQPLLNHLERESHQSLLGAPSRCKAGNGAGLGAGGGCGSASRAWSRLIHGNLGVGRRHQRRGGPRALGSWRWAGRRGQRLADRRVCFFRGKRMRMTIAFLFVESRGLYTLRAGRRLPGVRGADGSRGLPPARCSLAPTRNGSKFSKQQKGLEKRNNDNGVTAMISGGRSSRRCRHRFFSVVAEAQRLPAGGARLRGGWRFSAPRPGPRDWTDDWTLALGKVGGPPGLSRRGVAGPPGETLDLFAGASLLLRVGWRVEGMSIGRGNLGC